jgi:general stress protein 26
MTRDQVLAFVQRHKLAVQASVSGSGAPQAAVVGYVASDDFELFFDTLGTSRKAENLRRDPRIALVIGWDFEEACTVQLEGLVDAPQGQDLERLKALYFASFPDGRERERQPEIRYLRVRPHWVRFSDFRGAEPVIEEFGA